MLRKNKDVKINGQLCSFFVHMSGGFLFYFGDGRLIPENLFSVLIIRLINLYSLVLDYPHAQKNSNVRIKGQLGSLSVNQKETHVCKISEKYLLEIYY